MVSWFVWSGRMIDCSNGMIGRSAVFVDLVLWNSWFLEWFVGRCGWSCGWVVGWSVGIDGMVDWLVWFGSFPG